ncbi:MAG: bacterioferritin [Sandaracinus sp.]|nr:bacterioferritin [Sandaracinus sp.]|tara:strand:+ start:2343 stop:2810 length:468 start_codon:yes stop_codon:yes gene_type:complete
MKGNTKVIERLNAQLTKELTSVDQYVLQAAMFDDWGHRKLHARLAHEADDEREHARRLIERILFLDGTPDVATREPMKVGSDVRSMLQNDLAHELEVAASLREGITACRDAKDAGSRALLEELLVDTEEDHIRWLETQLHLIDTVGLERYLAEGI